MILRVQVSYGELSQLVISVLSLINFRFMGLFSILARIRTYKGISKNKYYSCLLIILIYLIIYRFTSLVLDFSNVILLNILVIGISILSILYYYVVLNILRKKISLYKNLSFVFPSLGRVRKDSREELIELHKLRNSPTVSPFDSFSLCRDIVEHKFQHSFFYPNMYFISFFIFIIFIILLIYFIKDIIISYSSYFFNHPVYKLFSNNLIISSLFLIIVKLIVDTNLTIRLNLLVVFTILAMYFNLRQKIKDPIARSLSFLLGYYYYSEYLMMATRKELVRNFYYDHVKGYPETFPKYYYYIYFEISFFFRYLFQQFYFYITFFRFIIDNNPKKYLIVHFLLFFFVIYIDHIIYFSFIALFLIFSKLLVYLSENSLIEVKYKLVLAGVNSKLVVNDLKYSYNNVMLFIFWNLRDLDSYYERLTFFPNGLRYQYFFNNMITIHHLNIKSKDNEILFDFTDKKKHEFFKFSLSLLLFAKTFKKPTFVNVFEYNIYDIMKKHILDVNFDEKSNGQCVLYLNALISHVDSSVSLGAEHFSPHAKDIHSKNTPDLWNKSTMQPPGIKKIFNSKKEAEDYIFNIYDFNVSKLPIEYDELSLPRKEYKYLDLNLLEKYINKNSFVNGILDDLIYIQMNSRIDFMTKCKLEQYGNGYTLINDFLAGKDISAVILEKKKLVSEDALSHQGDSSLRESYEKLITSYDSVLTKLEEKKTVIAIDTSPNSSFSELVEDIFQKKN